MVEAQVAVCVEEQLVVAFCRWTKDRLSVVTDRAVAEVKHTPADAHRLLRAADALHVSPFFVDRIPSPGSAVSGVDNAIASEKIGAAEFVGTRQLSCCKRSFAVGWADEELQCMSVSAVSRVV